MRLGVAVTMAYLVVDVVFIAIVEVRARSSAGVGWSRRARKAPQHEIVAVWAEVDLVHMGIAVEDNGTRHYRHSGHSIFSVLICPPTGRT